MRSIKELRKICQDKGYQEHPTMRFYRLFSIYITKICLITGLRPGLITISSFLSGIVGGYLYLSGYFILGSVLFVIYITFDYVDGEVARYRKSCSTFGAWLDSVSSHLLYPYFFFTLGLGIFFQTGVFWYIILGSVAAIVKLIERSVPQFSTGAGKPGKVLKSQNIISAKEWLSYIAKNTVLYPVILLCSITGWENWFLWFITAYLIFLALGKVFLIGWRIYSSEKQ